MKNHKIIVALLIISLLSFSIVSASWYDWVKNIFGKKILKAPQIRVIEDINGEKGIEGYQLCSLDPENPNQERIIKLKCPPNTIIDSGFEMCAPCTSVNIEGCPKGKGVVIDHHVCEPAGPGLSEEECTEEWQEKLGEKLCGKGDCASTFIEVCFNKEGELKWKTTKTCGSSGADCELTSLNLGGYETTGECNSGGICQCKLGSKIELQPKIKKHCGKQNTLGDCRGEQQAVAECVEKKLTKERKFEIKKEGEGSCLRITKNKKTREIIKEKIFGNAPPGDKSGCVLCLGPEQNPEAQLQKECKLKIGGKITFKGEEIIEIEEKEMTGRCELVEKYLEGSKSKYGVKEPKCSCTEPIGKSAYIVNTEIECGNDKKGCKDTVRVDYLCKSGIYEKDVYCGSIEMPAKDAEGKPTGCGGKCNREGESTKVREGASCVVKGIGIRTSNDGVCCYKNKIDDKEGLYCKKVNTGNKDTGDKC